MSLQIFGSASYKDPSTQLITCPSCNQTILRERVVEAISAMRFINEVSDGFLSLTDDLQIYKLQN